MKNLKLKGSLVALMSMSMLMSACNTDNKEEAGASPAASANNPVQSEAPKWSKPLTFTYYDHNDTQVRKPWGEPIAQKWVQDNMNINVEWISANGASNQKLNTMIVSNDLPDVINVQRGGVKNADINRLIEGGLVAPLDEYINKYPNLKKWATMDNLNLLKKADGKIYEIPVWFNSPGVANGNNGWMVNTKIYKELGSPKLETLEDLEKYLRLVKEKYPDVTPLEVGPKFEGAGIIYSAFRENTPRYFLGIHAVADGNTLKPILEDKSYQEFITYVNRLFQDKLITQDAFTQTLNQVQEKVNTGKVAVYAGNVAREGRNSVPNLRKNDPDAGYDAIWPIHKAGLDKNKIFPESFNSLGSGSVLISKKAKDTERIFEFLDWVVGDEGQSILVFGPKGLYWDDRDDKGVPIPNEKYKSTPVADINKEVNGANLLGNARFVDMAKYQREMMLPESQRNWEATQQFNVIWKTSYDVTTFFNTDPLPNSDEGIIAQQVKDIYDQAFSKAVFAKNNDEAQSILSKANEDMKKAGIDKLLKYRTDIWQKNVKSLGK